jgi:hypothetical protein
MIEGLIRSPRCSGDNKDESDDWTFEKVGMMWNEYFNSQFIVQLSFDILSF